MAKPPAHLGCAIDNSEVDLADAASAAVPTNGIEVYPLVDTDGGESQIGWYAKGHFDVGDFLLAVAEYEVEHNLSLPGIGDEDVTLVWWRSVPVIGDPGMMEFRETKPNARGAFEATVAHEASSWARGLKCPFRDCLEPAAGTILPLAVGSIEGHIGHLDVRPCTEHSAAMSATRRLAGEALGSDE